MKASLKGRGPREAGLEGRVAFAGEPGEIEAVCRGLARDLVGQLGLKEAQELLREEMYSEALARSGGSRRAAARILGINRRCVQRLVGALAATARCEAG